MSDALPYTCGTGIPRLLGVKNYLKNYFTVYKRLTRSRTLLENFHVYRDIVFTFYVSKYTHCIPIYMEVF